MFIKNGDPEKILHIVKTSDTDELDEQLKKAHDKALKEIKQSEKKDVEQ